MDLVLDVDLDLVLVLDLDLDLVRKLHRQTSMNYRNLEVYQFAVHACASLRMIAADRATDANDLLSSVVRMLSKMCRE